MNNVWMYMELRVFLETDKAILLLVEIEKGNFYEHLGRQGKLINYIFASNLDNG